MINVQGFTNLRHKIKKKKSITKFGIITRLCKEGYINDWILWNLLNPKYKKSEIVEIDKAFRKYCKKDKV